MASGSGASLKSKRERMKKRRPLKSFGSEPGHAVVSVSEYEQSDSRSKRRSVNGEDDAVKVVVIDSDNEEEQNEVELKNPSAAKPVVTIDLGTDSEDGEEGGAKLSAENESGEFDSDDDDEDDLISSTDSDCEDNDDSSDEDFKVDEDDDEDDDSTSYETEEDDSRRKRACCKSKEKTKKFGSFEE